MTLSPLQDQWTEEKEGYPVGTVVKVRSFTGLDIPDEIGVVIECRTNSKNIVENNGFIKEYLFLDENSSPYLSMARTTYNPEYHYKIMIGDVKGWRNERFVSPILHE